MSKKVRERPHSAPVELTEEQVRAAREGKGTHCLPEAGSRPKEPPQGKPKDKKSKH
jgi:hypothetical protein